MPKFNMYQSLHTTVIGPEGKPVELQIRTRGMHQQRRVRRRRALEVQGRDRRPAGPAQGGEAARHGLAAPAPRLAEGDRRPGGVPGVAALRPVGAEVFVFTPQGEVIALPQGATPVDFAYAIHTEVGHRTHRRPRQRPPGRRWSRPSTTATRWRSSPPSRRTPGPSRDWLQLRQERPRPQQDPALVLQGAPRDRRSRPGKEPLARAMRKQNLPLQRLLSGEALLTLARDLRYTGRVGALRGGRRGPRIGAQSVVAEARRARSAAPTARRRTSPRPRSRPASAAAGARRATPASWSRATPTSGYGCPSAAPRCPATRSSASSPAATASRCTGSTASTSANLQTQPDRMVE